LGACDRLGLAGDIDPGHVFGRSIALDDVAAGYGTMDAREALKVRVTP